MINRKYDFSDLEGATDAEVQQEIAEIRQEEVRLTREAKIWARDADALQEWHNARVAKSRRNLRTCVVAIAALMIAFHGYATPAMAGTKIIPGNWAPCATGVQRDEPSFDEIPAWANTAALRPYYDSDPRLLANHGLCNVKFHRVVLCLPGWQEDHANTPEFRVCEAWESHRKGARK